MLYLNGPYFIFLFLFTRFVLLPGVRYLVRFLKFREILRRVREAPTSSGHPQQGIIVGLKLGKNCNLDEIDFSNYLFCLKKIQ